MDDLTLMLACLKSKRSSKGNPRFKHGQVFPTDQALVLIEKDGQMEPASTVWGFPKFGHAKGVVFNARSESALEKPMFRKALLQNKAIVPTSGFYEWKTVPALKKKDHFRFVEPGQAVTWLAGFYNVFQGEPRFTILTNVNDGMSEYHDRMPVILHSDERQDWLDGNDLKDFLTRVPPDLDAIRIY